MSTTRPTEAAWRWEGRSTSVRACRPSLRGCSAKRLFWHLKAWNTLCNTCEAVSSQDTFMRCSSEASLWLRFTSSQACELRGSTCGFWRCLRSAYSASMARGSPWGTGTWSRLARNGQRQGRRHLGCYLCRGSRSGPRLFRALRSDGAPGATGQGGGQLSHCSAHVSLSKATSWGHRVLARRRPKPFPTQVPVGPRRQEEQFEWTWAAEEKPADLELAWLEWLRAEEAAWCWIHDLCGAQRRPFLERSKGLVIEHVSLGQATRNDTRRRCSKKAAAWRALRRLVAQAVGSLAGWRKERASQGTLQQSVNLLASISLPDLGLGSGTHSAQPGGTGLSRSQGSCFSSRVTHNKELTLRLWIRRVVGGNGRRKLARGSAGAAHGFSKAGLDLGDGEGLVGPQLLVNQIGTWLPLWLDPRRANAKQLADQEDKGEPLPRPSLEEVDNVCKTYKHTAGLGHDCINPKAILQLPVDLRVRFIDLLMAFEAKVDQTFELASHDGVEAQAIRRSSHNRPHGGSVAGLAAASKAAGAAVGERARCALLLGLPRARRATELLGHTPSRWRQPRDGSSRRLPCCSIWPSSTSTSGTTTSGKKARKPGFPHDCRLVGVPRTKAGVFSRPTSAPHFPSGPLGPFFQVAVGPRPPPNSCWQLSWKQ